MSCRLIFVARGEDCRVLMATAWARRLAGTHTAVHCAVTSVFAADPMAEAVMREVDLPLDAETPSALRSLDSTTFDIAVLMSDDTETDCPLLTGCPAILTWNLPDPAAFPEEPTARLGAYRALRDRLSALVTDLFAQGYLNAFAGLRGMESMILDSVSDGILAHDLDRRIVYFNRAAESITGLRREDVLAKDCHTVFEGRFCGGKCAFCADKPSHLSDTKRQVEFADAEGAPRLLDVAMKPLRTRNDRLVGVVLTFRDQTREQDLARRIGDIQTYAGIIGRDAKMQAVYALVRDVAYANIPVLIEGESGTGKELVAAAIHNESPRANRLFVPVNCGALPEGILESELFGHVKGAFTGAVRDKKGRFELADGGTIFLDEIGDIPPAMQVRLLRVLQEGAFERVGDEKTLTVNVRVISATHRDLRQEIADGRFREDLFYRLNVMPIRLPPLRERRLDIPLLAGHFLKRYTQEMHLDGVRVDQDAMEVMIGYDWPGNVRELQNWIQFALVKSRGATIGPEHLPPPHGAATNVARRIDPSAAPPRPLRRGRRGLSVERVREALEKFGGNRVEAARCLGVSRATLYRYFSDHPEIE